jgi:hypothetical protein
MNLRRDQYNYQLMCYAKFGDDAVKTPVCDAVHLTHASGTDWSLDFIRSKFRARGERHRWAQL